MTEHVIYMDTSQVLEGHLEDLKKVMSELVDFVEVNEPRIVSYSVFFNAEGSRMTVIHVHRDQASLEFHLGAAAHLFPGAGQHLRLEAIHVFGNIDSRLLQDLRRKAEMLGSGFVDVNNFHGGFLRPPDE